MAKESLPVAIIGVGGFGGQILRAFQRSETVKLVGVADKDSAVAAQAGAACKVESFTDNRSLLAQTKPKIVYLCVPPMAAPDLVAACAERGIHVWKEMPLARNLDEGVSLVHRMEDAGLKLAVGTQRRFAAGYYHAWMLRKRVSPVFLARAHYLFNWGPNLSWRGDKSSSGGGALLELGYHFLDLLIWMLGLPEEVYGASAGGNRPERSAADGKPLPLYDTDDTVAAILRYGRDTMASFTATRSSGPVSEGLSLHGRGGSIIATGETCLLRDPDGTTLDSLTDDSPPVDVFTHEVEAFARAVAGDSKTYECSARENLLNLAAIEAIYLSDRTGQPEHPSRLLKTHGYLPEDCLSLRPAEKNAE